MSGRGDRVVRAGRKLDDDDSPRPADNSVAAYTEPSAQYI